ncbi:MAG: 3-oxoacyl-ACP synthase III family protein [Gemmatimonadota bacterium]
MSTGERTARIAGWGSYLPSREVDNLALYECDSIRDAFDEERARGALRGVEDPSGLDGPEVFDQWARQVTGIETRRVLEWDGPETTETMCAEAGRRALAEAGLEAGDLDLIVAASITASDVVPNLACTVAAELGAPSVGGFEVNAACAGFVYALAAGHAFVCSGGADRVLLVSGDALSRVTNFSDPKTAVLFADGAGAVVLEATTDGAGVLGPPALSADYAPEHLHLRGRNWVDRGAPNPTLSMGGGPHVLRQAINAMLEVARRALEVTELTWDDIDYVIPHQANGRITSGLERALRLKKGKVVDTIAAYGNVSASTVPIALDEVLRGRHGPLPDPTRIVLTAVGGGYTSGAAVLEWRPPA